VIEATHEGEALLRLGVATLGGLAVGIEREWSAKKDGERTRFGGVRTFLLLGLSGGLAAEAGRAFGAGVAVALLVAATALVVSAYVVTAWRGAIDATTEVAGLVVVAAGALAGAGELAVASAVFAATALVLVEKGPMHGAVGRVKGPEIEAAARFAVLALVVLPLLPTQEIAWLGGMSARGLWGLVLLFSGLSFAGYVALRAAGPSRGLGLAGALGGIVSSTATTLNFARESRAHEALARPLALGALAANAVLPLRVGILSAVLNREVALALLPVAGAAGLVGAAIVAYSLLRARAAGKKGEEAGPKLPSNPLRLGAALQMTLLFAVVLYLLGLARERLGSAGLLAGAVFLGLTDLDALTLSMNRLADGSLAADQAARALSLGMLANTLFKAVVAAVVGAAAFRWIVLAGLAGFAAIFAAGFVLLG
jgi:uncharacterized membrane protein (DUF4010 family)